MSGDLERITPIVVSDIEGYRSELDSMYAEMRNFDPHELGDVFVKLASWSARVSEIRGRLCRSESRQRLAFRTKEVEPFLSEIDRQFRTYSRLQSTNEMDWKLAGKL